MNHHYVICVYENGTDVVPRVSVDTLACVRDYLEENFKTGLRDVEVRKNSPRQKEVAQGHRGARCVASYIYRLRSIDVFRVTPFRTETELREAHEALQQLTYQVEHAIRCREESPIEDIETSLDNMKEFLDAHT